PSGVVVLPRADPDLSRRRHHAHGSERAGPGAGRRRSGAQRRRAAPHEVSLPRTPHLPRRAPIDAYGQGGFRFADMSHRGSLLCLPSGIWAWPVTKVTEIDEISLSRVFAAANGIDSL